jgi:Tol biopolymer transport system component
LKTIKHNVRIFRFLYIIILIVVSVNQTSKSQNVVLNDNVISYCYQPLIPALGLPQIYAINSDGTNNRQIINSSIGLSHQDWSPDTMKFAVVGYLDGGYTTWSIFTFNSNGTNLIRLTTTNNVWDGDPVWSQDMNKIVFTRTYPNQNMKNELWIMNSDGSNQHYIGIEGKFGRWSKNGTRLIYCSKKTNSICDIYTCDTNGTNELRLTYSPVDTYFPVYSPDGNEVVYCAGSNNNMADWEIYKMKSDGTGVRKLTNNNASDNLPKWSPDGTMFAFISDRHLLGKPEVYIMDTSGANVQRVTYLPENITAVNPVWRKSGTTGVKNINSNIPGFCKLFQNYPNPFNPATKIKFEIPPFNPPLSKGGRGRVSLKIFDILGKEIATFVNKQLQPGTYEVTFDGSVLPSGVYFYQLMSGDFIDTKKMAFIK